MKRYRHPNTNGTILARKTPLKNLNILKVYFFVFLFYFLPFLSLFLFVVDQLTLNKTEMVFWMIFLVGLIPCATIGMILSIVGLVKSFKRNSRLNKIIGFIGLLFGLCCFTAGIFGVMLIYVVVS